MNWIALAVVATLVFMAGCASTDQADAASSLPTGSWTLTTIDNQPLPDPLPPGLRPITLSIDDTGFVSGRAGVNQYSGSVDTGAWQNREIVLGLLAVSRMAGPPAAMSTESAYLGMLDAVRSFEVDPAGGTLTLRGDAGELLVYQRTQ